MCVGLEQSNSFGFDMTQAVTLFGQLLRFSPDGQLLGVVEELGDLLSASITREGFIMVGTDSQFHVF